MGKGSLRDSIESKILKDIEEARERDIRQLENSVTKRADREMKQLAQEIVGDYYSGYTPRNYRRTHQLYNTLHGEATSVVNGDEWSVTISIDYDSPYGSKKMRHKRPASKFGKSRAPVDEEAIFESFMAGEHPSGFAGIPPTPNDNGAVARKDIEDILDEYADEIIPKYIDIATA